MDPAVCNIKCTVKPPKESSHDKSLGWSLGLSQEERSGIGLHRYIVVFVLLY